MMASLDSSLGDLNSSCSPISEVENHTLLIIYGSVGAVSMLTCLIGLLMSCILKLYKKYVYRLAMYQVTAAMFFGLTRSMQLSLLIFDNYNNRGNGYNILCKAMAYIIISISWAKLIFTVWITVHLIVYAIWFKNMRKLEIPLVVLGLLVGPLVASVPLFTHSYGRAGPWCWIISRRNSCSSDLEGQIQQFAIWYGPGLFVLTITSLLATATIFVMGYRICCNKRLRQQNVGERTELLQKARVQRQVLIMLLPLLAYPLIYCTLFVVPAANRFYEFISGTPNFGLFVASAIFIPGSSFAAGAAFIFHIVVVECKRLSHNFHFGVRGSKFSKCPSTYYDVVNESELDREFDESNN